MERASTIAAIATAPGRGGVAVIRVSGPDAFAIAERLTGKKPTPGKISYGTIRAEVENSRIVTLDEGVILAFKSPRSYTGEDVIEFQSHGGFVTPKRILEATIAAGARLARRGEFTERAFLNGKLSLDQAQAVLDLIDARTTRAADAAVSTLASNKTPGVANGDVRALYDAALEISSTVEHALDIDEGELPDSFFTRLSDALQNLTAALARAIRQLRERRLLRAGALVVLAGPPNAGKSSLMNALLKENRAIVSDVPGTTRDSIEEWLDLDGWPVRLVDTAGLRATDDQIEAEGVRRTEALLEKANIVLRLGDDAMGGDAIGGDAMGGDASSVGDEEFIPPLPRRRDASAPIAIRSKSDLISPDSRLAGLLYVSSKTGEGLDELRAALVARLERLADSAAPESEDDLSARLAVLLEASARVADATAAAGDLVLQGNHLRRACETLGSLLGATYTSDLLSRIFSRFCVGK